MTQLSQDLLKKIKKIEIKTRQIVTSTFSGEYQSVFKGQGIDFVESREYQTGDDTRFIDWKVTARAGKPYVKLFEESRELTVLLMVDLSASSRFGSHQQTKMDVMAEVAAVLGFSACSNRDQVGLFLFTEEVEHYVPPKKGKDHMMRMLADIFYYQPKRTGTSISSALDYLLKAQKKKAIVFLISDFLDDGYEAKLRVASRKHDVVPILVEDPFEQVLPQVGYVALEDAETGDPLLLDMRSDDQRAVLENMAYSRRVQQDQLFSSMNVMPIRIDTTQPFIQPLAHYFKARVR